MKNKKNKKSTWKLEINFKETEEIYVTKNCQWNPLLIK